jgi:hypothetical protein
VLKNAVTGDALVLLLPEPVPSASGPLPGTVPIVYPALKPNAYSAGTHLLPRPKSHDAWYMMLHLALRRAALQAGCSRRPTLHQLRHTFATSMIRAGLPLPTLMRLLGHRNIRMTLGYVEVCSEDLQRQFQLARLQGNANQHTLPALPLPQHALPTGLPGVRQALEAARSVLETFRRDVHDVPTRHKFNRLAKRFSALAAEIKNLITPEN